ncbi:MAG: IS110 family transposase [Coleofasciculaceae cyanobacterium SM2_3_26]|nr:IS110 family transposase [Coleofasciculaceae cyanobacterium SM2_3_26]
MKICGLDVAAGYLVACPLSDSHVHTDVRELYYSIDFQTFPATSVGMQKLLALSPDVAVMEPTGVNYSRLWVFHLQRAGVRVFQVGHKELRRFRENLDLPDKDDPADALALALYFQQHQGIAKRFIRTRDPDVLRIRELSLRIEHGNREQSPLINRIRQDLHWQFPEAADISLPNNATLFWAWLAGLRESKRWDKIYAASIGIGISSIIREDAKRLLDIQEREQRFDAELRLLLAAEKFDPYNEVFDRFGFGLRIRSAILAQIYPLQDFLDDDGNPAIVVRKGKVSGKPTKRHLSLRRFRKILGIAPTREQSGTSVKKSKKAGSALCRKVFWQWVFTAVEVRKRRTTPILQELGAHLDEEKANHMPVQKARARVAAKACVRLFYELLNAVQSGQSSPAEESN